MISTPDRQRAIALIEDARAQGARLEAACRELGITARTYQRWTRDGELREDQRPLVDRPVPANALTPAGRRRSSTCATAPSTRACRQSRSWCVCSTRSSATWPLPRRSTASCTSIGKWCIVAVRNTSAPRQAHDLPGDCAEQVVVGRDLDGWSDQGAVLLPGDDLIDIFSRKITGWEVFLAESAHNSRSVLERAVLAEQIIDQPLVLHADNGSPFKGAALLEKLHDLGGHITPSFSRPRVVTIILTRRRCPGPRGARPCSPSTGLPPSNDARGVHPAACSR